MSGYRDFFNSYARKSPTREEFVAKTGLIDPGYSEDALEIFEIEEGKEIYIRANAKNYPKLYEAVQAECKFREIDEPAFYIDHSGVCRLGHAKRSLYAVFIEPDAYEKFDKDELRALVAHEIKHLFQSDETPMDESEYDADRAAVSSTSYDTIRSYVHKSIELQILQNIPNGLFKSLLLKFHAIFPNFIGENMWVAIDPRETDLFKLRIRRDHFHPSPASRMRAMRKWEKKMAEAECEIS